MINKVFAVIGAFMLALAPLFWYAWLEIHSRLNYNYKTLSHIKQLGEAFLAYHQHKGKFPPAYLLDSKGKKLHSWRPLLLETEGPDVFTKIRLSEPWNSEHNKQFETHMPLFLVPPTVPTNTDQRFVTDYYVMVDKDSPFPGPLATSLKGVVNDKSTTILVFEAPGRYVHWMEPVDFDKQSFSAYYERYLEELYRGRIRYHPALCMIDDTVEYNSGYSLGVMLRMFSIH